jgi:hypothetical protein
LDDCQDAVIPAGACPRTVLRLTAGWVGVFVGERRTDAEFDESKSAHEKCTMVTTPASGLWEKRIADAILAAEKPAAMLRIKELAIFKEVADEAVRLHETIFDCLVQVGGGPELFAVAGAWHGPQNIAASVVVLPSLTRRPEAEKALAELGRLLGDRLGGLSLNMGLGCPRGRLVWCDENYHERDISDAEDLRTLFLELRTERAEDERFRDVYDALRAGQLPKPII